VNKIQVTHVLRYCAVYHFNLTENMNIINLMSTVFQLLDTLIFIKNM